MSHSFMQSKSIIKNPLKIVLCIFLLLILVQGVQAAGTTVDFSANATSATAIADSSTTYRSPWVTNTNTTSATINWRGESNGAGSIDYATSIYYTQHHSFDKRITSSEIASYQHLEINGLTPNTSYTYRVEPSGNMSAFGNRTFRTMPISGPFTFIVISDSQEGHNYTEWMRFKYVADAVANETDVLFILHGGDYAGHDSVDLWDTYFEVADGMLAKNAIFTNIGNHEYHNASGGDSPPSGAVQYHTSYNNPLNYSFDCADVRFVILNSPDPNNANGDDPHTSLALATSQESWLREQLDNKLSGTFTIHHHPIWDYYNSSSNADLQPWETLYHIFNISATFAGHTHNYQRYSVMGIPYFIVGNAGGICADLNSSEAPPVWYQGGETRQLGYLKVFVDPANNSATAQEIFVASVQEDDSNETPAAYNPPFIAETFTFPLKVNNTIPEPTVGASVGVFRSGVFYLRNENSAGDANNVFSYGAAGDTPIAGDWTGKGYDTVGVFRQGQFYLASSNIDGGGDVTAFNFGAANDVPVIWKHDGKDTVGIFRSGTFYLKNTNSAGNADNVFSYGAASDLPVTGKWT